MRRLDGPIPFRGGGFSPRERWLAGAATLLALILFWQFGTYAGEKLQLAGVRPTDDGQLLATVRVGSQDDAKLVTWRLHNSGPQIWRAVDIISDGRSAVLDAHNEFAAVLQSFGGDIEALIAFMQK